MSGGATIGMFVKENKIYFNIAGITVRQKNGAILATKIQIIKNLIDLYNDSNEKSVATIKKYL